MNDKSFENKVSQDMDRTKKDLVMLGNDGITGLTRKVEKMSGSLQKKATASVKTFNKAVDHGLRQYNTQIQHVADKVPGEFGKKATGYPWVTITFSLVVGLLLGALLKPTRQYMVTEA